jgi:hypothetical protein
MERVYTNDLGAIACNAQAVVYTPSFRLQQGTNFSLGYQAAHASANPDLKLELEESVTGKQPTTEEAADATNFVVAEGVSAIEANLTTKTAHLKTLTPVVSQWGRIKITGVRVKMRGLCG